MAIKKNNLNPEVTTFLDELDHPFREEIELLRKIICSADDSLTENVKWNAPNYASASEDRITMRINPPRQIQLIFHRGAKVLTPPPTKLIDDQSGLLVWKGNDRAVAAFKNADDIKKHKGHLTKIVKDWILSA